MAVPPHYKYELHAVLAPDGCWEVGYYFFREHEVDFTIAVYTENANFWNAVSAAYVSMGQAQEQLEQHFLLLPDLGNGVKVRYGPNVGQG